MRRFLIALGIASLAGGALCIQQRHWVPAIDLFAGGGVLLAALLFERWRYKRPAIGTVGHWQETGERFLDPTSGKPMEVFYNPATGERDYRER